MITDVRNRQIRGLDLRIRRLRAGISQTDLAVAMGTARPRVSVIEATYRPSAKAVERYLSALEQLRAGGG